MAEAVSRADLVLVLSERESSALYYALRYIRSLDDDTFYQPYWNVLEGMIAEVWE